MNTLASKALCLLIGYGLGMILTAEIVTRKMTGKPCKYLGTSGNPGMANVMAHLGFVPGILVLAGDLLKVVAAVVIAQIFFVPAAGHVAVLYAGLGAVLGHNFPAWMKFNGGKGVAATCAAIFLFMPGFGTLAMLLGMVVVFATKYLCLGGAAIPAVFMIPAFLLAGREAGILALILTVLMFLRNWKQIRLIPSGRAEQVDVLGKLRSKLAKH